jgi:hypothetical protein
MATSPSRVRDGGDAVAKTRNHQVDLLLEAGASRQLAPRPLLDGPAGAGGRGVRRCTRTRMFGLDASHWPRRRHRLHEVYLQLDRLGVWTLIQFINAANQRHLPVSTKLSYTSYWPGVRPRDEEPWHRFVNRHRRRGRSPRGVAARDVREH